MSNATSTWAKQQRCGCPYVKAVLIELADWARPDGVCEFRRVSDIAQVTEISERTVQRALKKLEDDVSAGGLGLIRRVVRHRRDGGFAASRFELVGYMYLGDCLTHGEVSDSHHTMRQAVTSGVTDRRGRGCQTDTSNKELDLNTKIPLNPPKTGERKARVRIGSDWQAPAVEALSPAAQEAARQWPPGAYAAQAEAFAKFHQGTGRRGADWEALWAAWVIQKHEAVMRAGKSGRGVAAPAEPVQARHAEAKPASAAKVREDARSADLHDVLRDQVGDAVWQDWYAPAALLVGDDVLVVAAPTDFHRSWMEERCSEALGRALDTLGIGVDGMRFETSPPSARSAGRGKRA